MMPTKNFLRHSDQVARLRLAEQEAERERKTAKPVKAKTIQQPPIPPIQTAQPIAKKPDWVNVLVEAVRGDGQMARQITMIPWDLARLLGLPAGTGMAAILGVLETERQALLAAGIRYFPYGRTARSGESQCNHFSAITFRMLELDSP
jgi:hypothetical protein